MTQFDGISSSAKINVYLIFFVRSKTSHEMGGVAINSKFFGIVFNWKISDELEQIYSYYAIANSAVKNPGRPHKKGPPVVFVGKFTDNFYFLFILRNDGYYGSDDKLQVLGDTDGEDMKAGEELWAVNQRFSAN